MKPQGDRPCPIPQSRPHNAEPGGEPADRMAAERGQGWLRFVGTGRPAMAAAGWGQSGY